MKKLINVSIFLFFVSIATSFAQYKPYHKSFSGDEFGETSWNSDNDNTHTYDPYDCGYGTSIYVNADVYAFSYKIRGEALIKAGAQIGTTLIQAKIDESLFVGWKSNNESNNALNRYYTPKISFYFKNFEGYGIADVTVSW